MFEKLANFILKHSKAIVAFWIVFLVCAIPFAAQSSSVLQYDVTTMQGANSEAVEGLTLIDENFSTGLGLSSVIVVSYDSADELTEAQALAGAGTTPGELQKYFDEKYGDGIFTLTSLGRYNKSGDIADSGILLISIACSDENMDVTHQTDDIRDLISQAKSDLGYTDLTTYVTGAAPLAYDTEEKSVSDVEKIDPFSVALVFIILAIFFWAIVTAAVPPMAVGMAYGVVMALLYAIGSFLDVYYITSIIVLVSMLGAGSDYAIFIITRYREERKNGKSENEALTTAVQWAGESVLTSGLTVIIGFAALSLCSFSMIQTMGMVLALGIVVALFASLTFIPALIHLLDGKIFWPSTIAFYQKESQASHEHSGVHGIHGHLFNGSRRYFTWVSKVTRKHAKAIVIVTLLITVPAAYAFATTEDSYDMISIMPDSESVDGLNTIMSQTDGGTIMPTYVVLHLNSSIATIDSSKHTLVWSAEADVESTTGYLGQITSIDLQIEAEHSGIIGSISGPTPWAWIYRETQDSLIAAGISNPTVAQINQAAYEQMPDAIQPYIYEVFTSSSNPFGWSLPVSYASPTIDYIVNYGTGLISDDGTYVKISIINNEKPMSDNTMTFVKDLKVDFHDGSDSYDTKYSDMIESSYVSGTSAAMNDISNTVNSQFHWIRLVVIVLIILLLFLILGSYLTPIRATLSIVFSIMWTLALTHLVFTTCFNIPVIWVVPIVLFVILLGLGMDYDVLLTTRIRENRLKGASNDDAIDRAVKYSGDIITLCGLLMGGTFLTLLVGDSSMLQEFGFALGFGILIDALFMVTYFVPACMHLMGEWSWKGPSFLKNRRNGQAAPAANETPTQQPTEQSIQNNADKKQ